MKPADQLSLFIRQGLQAGHSPETLRSALEDAGWTGAEVDTALAGWSDGGLGVPVPRPRASVPVREAVVHALLFLALVAVTWHLTSLGFRLIEIWVPDDTAGHRAGWAGSSMRWSMATLIVLAPLFLWLHLHTERAATDNDGLRRAPMRARIGALGLLLAALVLLGDAVAVVYAALSGDLTGQFLAKATLVAMVALLVLSYFRRFLDTG